MLPGDRNSQPPSQYGNREESASSQQQNANNAEHISRDEQVKYGTRPEDQYGAQDQFGDVDNQDPYSNLYDEEMEDTPGGEGIENPEGILYGLEAPTGEPIPAGEANELRGFDDADNENVNNQNRYSTWDMCVILRCRSA
jgi:hypothetical protein